MDEVTIEQRLGGIERTIAAGHDRLEAELRTIGVELAGVKQAKREQNGRIEKLEAWRHGREIVIAHEDGQREGRTAISKGQLAIIASVGPAAIALVDVFVRLVT